MKRFLAMVLAAWMVCATALGETSDVDEAVRKIFKGNTAQMSWCGGE